MAQCDRCGNAVNGTDLCPSCGAILGLPAPECELHADLPAVARCVVCGKPVCGDCATRRGGRFFCEAPSHRDVASETTVLAVCSSPFEADMIRENLAQAGLEVIAFARNEFNSLALLPLPSVVDVRIRSDQAGQAREILKKLALDEESRREL